MAQQGSRDELLQASPLLSAALGRERIGKRQGLIQKIRCRDNVIDEAETCRFRGIKTASRQHLFCGGLPADLARKPLRTTECCNDADVDLGLAESGGACGKDNASPLD